MNSVGRKQRRRVVRPSSRRQQTSKTCDVSSSTSKSTSSAATAECAALQAEQSERMELDGDYKETNLQILRTHSSSDSSISYSNCNNKRSNNNNNNIKTVLQPTMVNTNSSKSSCNGNNSNNKTTNAAKLCDESDREQEPERAMDEDDFEDEDDMGDGDSGYEFALEPQSQSLHISAQQHQSQTTHNEGLLSIALKTIKLVQRNKLLQKRLAQLQLETSEFIASVLANPENRHFREKISAKSDGSGNKVSNVLLRH